MNKFGATHILYPSPPHGSLIYVLSVCLGVQEMVRRKQVGNPVDLFNKTFAEYKEGFSANGDEQQKKEKLNWNILLGESWLGLENLHRLTSQQSYSLQVTMTDWDQKTYVAVYHQFEVRQIK